MTSIHSSPLCLRFQSASKLILANVFFCFSFYLRVVLNVSWNQRKTIVLLPSNLCKSTYWCTWKWKVTIKSFLICHFNLIYLITPETGTKKTSANNFIIILTEYQSARGLFFRLPRQTVDRKQAKTKNSTQITSVAERWNFIVNIAASICFRFHELHNAHMCNVMSAERNCVVYVLNDYSVELQRFVSSVYSFSSKLIACHHSSLVRRIIFCFVLATKNAETLQTKTQKKNSDLPNTRHTCRIINLAQLCIFQRRNEHDVYDFLCQNFSFPSQWFSWMAFNGNLLCRNDDKETPTDSLMAEPLVISVMLWLKHHRKIAREKELRMNTCASQ